MAHAGVKKFVNLSATEVRIDSVLPYYVCSIPLPENYQDSIYSAKIAYPEFIDMSMADVAKYNHLSGAVLPQLPQVNQHVVLSRKKGALEISLCPLVYRDNRYRIMVSFMLEVEARAVRRSAMRTRAAASTSPADRYAAHSVLAKGTWAKIKVPTDGVYELTEAVIRKAGFSDLSKVKIYGYGGNLQNEKLNAADLVKYDDLKEVPTCTVGGRRLFYGRGPVSWSSKRATRRVRNPYADYGCYFITQDGGEPLVVTPDDFLASVYPSHADYHSLYEKDGFAWYAGGRNLFDPEPINMGSSKKYVIQNPGLSPYAQLAVNISSGIASQARIELNGKVLGTLSTSLGEYDKGVQREGVYNVNELQAADTVTITTVSGGPVRLDYIAFAYYKPKDAPSLEQAFPAAEYVYNITNQDLHGDGFADMVIIIPTSQKLREQAERLKKFHEEHDGMRVRIVPADELYNEFSSGTPDANAYRRYLKMLYDRATTEADMPKYLLLFGDGVWDNRMLTSSTRGFNPDDYLLCFESENSFSVLYCYVDDGFYGLLDDGEGTNPQSHDKLDIGVGRFPVTTPEEAKVMVDKTIAYVENKNAGAWQNTLVFMGDDGNDNLHMNDLDDAAEDVAKRYPGYLVKKIMWDAYTRETSATGNTYPEVSRLIKQNQSAGALIMDYAGHGSEIQVSHEAVLRIGDFSSFSNTNMPLWITASCDIMPFDSNIPNIGESAVLNPKGGTMAFFGTTRTVDAWHNKRINMAFLRHVLGRENGKPVTLGMAQMMAKNDMIDTQQDHTTNKLQYSLLGDPAIALNLPSATVVVDSINGKAVSSASPAVLNAGSIATISGHIEGLPSFKGTVTATVRDSRELVRGKQNDAAETPEAFEFYDRTKTLYMGSDSIGNGKFRLSFAVPMDLNYSDGTGLINLYAVNADHSIVANGYSDAFKVGGDGTAVNDSIGPSIYCYLNTPSFADGGKVNSRPYFVALLSDKNGLNVAGSGIGHDLQLIIDGDMSQSYNLNANFSFDFGSYKSGSTYYNIPELTVGKHQLVFRAWDILNNSSTAVLNFEVAKGLEPSIYSVSCTKNPATTATTFIVSHDRTGADVDVEVCVFDMSGRELWRHHSKGVSATGVYTVDWDLCVASGQRLQTGVYLYRVRLSSDGSSYASKAKKLIVVGNN